MPGTVVACAGPQRRNAVVVERAAEDVLRRLREAGTPKAIVLTWIGNLLNNTEDLAFVKDESRADEPAAQAPTSTNDRGLGKRKREPGDDKCGFYAAKKRKRSTVFATPAAGPSSEDGSGDDSGYEGDDEDSGDEGVGEHGRMGWRRVLVPRRRHQKGDGF
ncbi:hypothetical protein VTJ04DRAFT_5754 [Mycothermus thermophilus]|uniref:uncharacterized protein n=1 Tax=Humicola insolens TaxID=85995 RepID=UPI0037448C28